MYKKIIRMNKKDRQDLISGMTYRETTDYFNYLNTMDNLNTYKKNVIQQDNKFLQKMTNSFYSENKIYQKMKNGMVGGSTSSNNKDFDPDKKVFFENILNYPKSSFCEILLKDNHMCLKTSDSLIDTKKILESITDDEINNKHFWKVIIYNFIEFLLCCDIFYTDDRFKDLQLDIITPICSLILSRIEFNRVAVEYINVIITNQPDIYVKEFHDLQTQKEIIKKINGIRSNQYINNKMQTTNLINKYSYGKIFINNILYKFKRRNSFD